MKKFITFIVAAFCLASSMSAQGSYYYYHGAKMPLSEELSSTKLMAHIGQALKNHNVVTTAGLLNQA